MLQAGTCAHTGAGFATIGAGRANAGGTARWHASVIFHGAPVDWSSIADGRHAIRILSGSRPLGCGVIPGLS
jgi:hypothetical protein